jgi:hypothetical protein
MVVCDRFKHPTNHPQAYSKNPMSWSFRWACGACSGHDAMLPPDQIGSTKMDQHTQTSPASVRDKFRVLNTMPARCRYCSIQWGSVRLVGVSGPAGYSSQRKNMSSFPQWLESISTYKRRYSLSLQPWLPTYLSPPLLHLINHLDHLL